MWRLALNPAAHIGEVENAAVMILNSLRKRGFKPEALGISSVPPGAGNGNGNGNGNGIDWGKVVFTFGKNKGKSIKDVDPAYLLWASDWIRNGDDSLREKFGHFGRAIDRYIDEQDRR